MSNKRGFRGDQGYHNSGSEGPEGPACPEGAQEGLRRYKGTTEGFQVVQGTIQWSQGVRGHHTKFSEGLEVRGGPGVPQEAASDPLTFNPCDAPELKNKKKQVQFA